jgi:hypothetical protein
MCYAVNWDMCSIRTENSLIEIVNQLGSEENKFQIDNSMELYLCNKDT